MGDLVLVYTLKQFQSKFSKASQGPFLISRLSSSGAIKLSNLDGEEFPNWISGCHVKKYYTPLTTKELERLHKTKRRQEKRRLVAVSAREEARERAKNKEMEVWFLLTKGLLNAKSLRLLRKIWTKI